jgi:hypothetical protein
MRAFQSVPPVFAAGANMTVTNSGGVVTYSSTGGGGGGATAARHFTYRPCTSSAGQGNFVSGAFAQETYAYAIGDTCVVDLASSGGKYLIFEHWIPSTWDSGTINVSLLWTQNAGGSGNVQWDIGTACFGPGASIFWPTYNNTAVTGAAPPSNTLAILTTNISTTGCTTNSLMYIKIANHATGTGGTTFTGDVAALLLDLSIVE